MATFTAIKDPQDIIVWDLRWHQWLASGESISTSTWSITGNESPIILAVDSSVVTDYTGQSPLLANTVARVTVSGGTVGLTYALTNHIVTSESQEFDRTIEVRMIDR